MIVPISQVVTLLVTVALTRSVSSLPIADQLPPSVRKSYSGYSLLRTAPIFGEDVASSLMVLDGMRGVHFWKYPLVNTSTDILASPTQLSHIQSLLDSLGLQHKILIPDVEELLQGENRPEEDAAPGNDADARFTAFFKRYQRYDAIMKYVSSLAKSDPGRVTFESLGTSSEGREIGIVTISSGGNKPGIWIDAGMHAREWVTIPTAIYIMDKLIRDPDFKWMVDYFDWYIVPLINVDGYEYSHTGDRMWRKTRSRDNGPCIGVDPNRNWNYAWATTGSSWDPCVETFHGRNPFSEPETFAVARAILARRNILMYISFHSYSQMWFIPYANEKGTHPPDFEELTRLANVGASALYSKYKTRYKVGTAADLLYPAGGGSDDWAKGVAGIKYVYCLELRDTGTFGFILPSDQILPSGEETFDAVVAVARDLLQDKVPPPPATDLG